MPPRASHLPNTFERDALQELKNGELPAQRLGTASRIAKLLAKGWIERGSADSDLSNYSRWNRSIAKALEVKK